MEKSDLRRWILLLPAAILVGFILSGQAGRGPVPALAADPLQQSTEEYCLSCHGNPDLSMTLPSGEEMSVYVPPEAWQDSVHGELGIECHACHPGIDTYPHDPIQVETRRELTISYYEACQTCHPDLYDETQDSIHGEALEQGNLNAPVCSDCHGAHDIQPIDQPRSRISETCGQCHGEVFEIYRDSVHGAALLGEGNPDVPTCIDCHGVHDIHDPTTEIFRVETPELCAGCHADPELMARYGLSADVYSTYLLSWHGVDVTVFQARWPTLWHQSAVCTDCHGVHDILPTENSASRVHPDNLLGTCQNCHENAGPRFVSAWTGHFPISVERTPYVYYTGVFYDSFAYASLAVSAIYVLLQIIRATAARIKRAL